MISGLDHVNIETSELEETIQFYEDVLGLENGERPPLISREHGSTQVAIR